MRATLHWLLAGGVTDLLALLDGVVSEPVKERAFLNVAYRFHSPPLTCQMMNCLATRRASHYAVCTNSARGGS